MKGGARKTSVGRGAGRRKESFDARQRAILEAIGGGAALGDVLDKIVRLVEDQSTGLLCSVLLLDAAEGRLRHGAAPSLPDAYNRAIDGAAIGPDAGSCGAAAFRGERVIVDDIDSHPNWQPYKHLALPHGLRACWSTPISSPERKVLGTFACYHRVRRAPRAREIQWVDAATHLASIAILRDRQDRAIREREAELAARERIRSAVYDNVSDVIFYIGVEPTGGYRFISVNRAFLRATGLTLDQIVGKRVDDVVPEPSRTQVIACYERAMRERRTITWDEVTPYPSGIKYGEVAVTPVFDDAGACTSLVGTVRDITDRKAAERRIAEQAAILDRASDAIVVYGFDDGAVRYWNQGAGQLYGFTSAEAVGRGIGELVYADASTPAEVKLRALEYGAWSGELPHVTRDGRALAVVTSFTLERDDAGRPSAVLAISTDVTARRKLEAQVAHAQRMESLGTLAGGIAHDFNNILTSIIGNTALARKHVPPDSPALPRLDVIASASVRASDLVRRILTFSRRREPRRSFVDLRPIVQDAIELLSATMPPAAAIRSRLEGGCSVLGDPSQLHQVVMNLGTNARQALRPDGGTIEVVLEARDLAREDAALPAGLAAGRYVRLSVSDDGSGMDTAIQTRIFEPFFTTRGPGVGTGLGLSVVHGIVTVHGGTLRVTSRVGIGTTFDVYFPAARATGEATTAEQRAGGRGCRVLYVDGEEAMVTLVTTLLLGLSYRVTGATDPRAALRAVVSDPAAFDAVVTDHAMEGMTGLELARAIRGVRQDLPVVMISGILDPAAISAARDEGVSAVVARSDLLDELPRVLPPLLARPEA
ncbi:MAG: PAS domain S-box protein [Acidobacteriota bacterium]